MKLYLVMGIFAAGKFITHFSIFQPNSVAHSEQKKMVANVE